MMNNYGRALLAEEDEREDCLLVDVCGGRGERLTGGERGKWFVVEGLGALDALTRWK